eukprot:m.84877 g.84877  ORF g.84877 m.84877 type:complete len:433 (-) comp8722_c0_seq5:1030-2328(-)
MVNTPICCPSRTETFSGRYFHNIGPPHEQGGCMFANTTNAVGPDGLFASLKRNGYNVGVFGKVTNDQSNVLDLAIKLETMTYIDSPVDYNNYMGVTYQRLFPNGTNFVETLNGKAPIFNTPYQTTQIGNRTLRWLTDALTKDTPFFAYIGPHAPHFPATPAPWYETLWKNGSAPMTPNYNFSDPGKPQHIRQNPPLTQDVKCWEDQHFRDRWSSLKSVDEIVEVVHDLLEASGKLNNTYFIYTSDHGYKLGQWRVGTSKQHPYETDIHVPFIIKGPNIPHNQTFSQLSGNVDILPTVLDLAGIDVPSIVDGKSIKQFLFNPHHEDSTWRKNILIEYKSVGTYYNDHSTIWAPETKICATSGPPRGLNPSITKCNEESELPLCLRGLLLASSHFLDAIHKNLFVVVGWFKPELGMGHASLLIPLFPITGVFSG